MRGLADVFVGTRASTARFLVRRTIRARQGLGEGKLQSGRSTVVTWARVVRFWVLGGGYLCPVRRLALPLYGNESRSIAAAMTSDPTITYPTPAAGDVLLFKLDSGSFGTTAFARSHSSI